jgi:hypothetical protein
MSRPAALITLMIVWIELMIADAREEARDRPADRHPHAYRIHHRSAASSRFLPERERIDCMQAAKAGDVRHPFAPLCGPQ